MLNCYNLPSLDTESPLTFCYNQFIFLHIFRFWLPCSTVLWSYQAIWYEHIGQQPEGGKDSNSASVLHVNLICLQVIHFVRPYRCVGWCCFCCLQEMEVQSPPGTTIGWIKQDCYFVFPSFSILNAERETVLKIRGPCWTCKWCDVEFKVRYIKCNGGRHHSCFLGTLWSHATYLYQALLSENFKQFQNVCRFFLLMALRKWAR